MLYFSAASFTSKISYSLSKTDYYLNLCTIQLFGYDTCQMTSATTSFLDTPVTTLSLTNNSNPTVNISLSYLVGGTSLSVNGFCALSLRFVMTYEGFVVLNTSSSSALSGTDQYKVSYSGLVLDPTTLTVLYPISATTKYDTFSSSIL